MRCVDVAAGEHNFTRAAEQLDHLGFGASATGSESRDDHPRRSK
jgi:hypothetical protein